MVAMSGVADAGRLRWAEIIAVGTELLVAPRIDTNSLFITERLNDLGIEVRAKAIVGDRRGDLESVLRAALDRTGLVVVCGGLGPTEDDLTRDAVAAVLGRPMREDADVLARIRRRFEARGARMAEINGRQAQVPDGAVVLANTLGTAPGLWIEHGDRIVILLPGPPGELKPMFERVAAGRLAPLAGDLRLHRRVVAISGRTESEVDEVAAPIYARWLDAPLPIHTTVLTSPAQVELHLSTRAASPAAAATRLDLAAAEILAVMGPDVISTDGRSVEATVGALLVERGWRIAVAESCTGGLVSSRLTDVAGSSAYVLMNVVCYSNASKTEWLGVPAALVDREGAVSEAVAVAMADGVRTRAGVELGVGVTGIAGPSGGTEAKPVGTVAIAATTAASRLVRTFRFPVGRSRVKQFAAQMALDLARRVLVGADPGRAFVVGGGSGARR
jgi:nicotinamide-nucleotide amidase